MFGHWETSDVVLQLLQEAINKYIECYGSKEFIVGYYGNFDYLASKATITAKRLHLEITLPKLIPYHPDEMSIEKLTGDNTYDVPRKLTIGVSQINHRLCRWSQKALASS